MPCDGLHEPDEYWDDLDHRTDKDWDNAETYNPWEQDMKSADVIRRKLQEDIDRAAAHLERLNRYGDDPFEDGTVIAFDKVFGNPVYCEPRTYSYAAIRAGGKWWTTSPRSPKGYEWWELREFIGDAEIYWAKDMEQWEDQ